MSRRWSECRSSIPSLEWQGLPIVGAGRRRAQSRRGVTLALVAGLAFAAGFGSTLAAIHWVIG